MILICSSKIVHNGNLLDSIMEIPSILEGLPKSELTRHYSMAGVVVQCNWLIFRVVYNSIMEYSTTRVHKGLKRGFDCLKEIW